MWDNALRTSNTFDMEANELIILVVEDDEPSFLYLKTILKQIPATILRARNGKEAVDLCIEFPGISVVLMDLKMPVMDGLDATSKIKTLRKDLPVIVITAYALSGDERMAMASGCDDYLTKPVKKALLFKKLKRYGITPTE
jgi:CheY-like chemotaxis protein